MKAVCISIQPKWCELIVSGKKTLEVRKSRPNLGAPFKCYIYCTAPKWEDGASYLVKWPTSVDENRISCVHEYDIPKYSTRLNKKVIGEFTCDSITKLWPTSTGCDGLVRYNGLSEAGLEATCLTKDDLCQYGNWKYLFAWSISNLVIYDKTKELSEFVKPCPHGEGSSCWLCDKSGFAPDMVLQCCNTVERPPQSWCYVEEDKP